MKARAVPDACTGCAQQVDHQDSIVSRLVVLRRSTAVLKTSTPMLRSSTGHPNYKSCSIEEVFIP